MREQKLFTMEKNVPIARATYEMTLRGDTVGFSAPGQFVQLQLDGFYLRRPISVCDIEDDRLTLIYKTVGKGTEAMSALLPGAELDLLTGLGNGFDCAKSGRRPLLIGGGVGTPPLYLLAKRLKESGRQPAVILGFNTAAEVFYEAKFQELTDRVAIATADGSYGVRGFVTDAIAAVQPDYDYYFTCGPEPMLRAVYEMCTADGQLSFEEHMACGFGACMGCSHRTKDGYKRLCKDGPVLGKGEVLWQTQA